MGYPEISDELISRRVRVSNRDICDADEWFRAVLTLWESVDRGGLLPSRSDLDPIVLMKTAKGRAHIVDTSSANPEDYRFRLWGTVNSYDGEHTSKRLGDMPSGPMQDAARDDYWEVVTTGCPSYHLLRHQEHGISYNYSRLILPLAKDGRRVDQLLVFINERQIIELDDATPNQRLPANPFLAVASPDNSLPSKQSIKRFFDC